jgi:TRAP-type C4-dicarboxylate transport system substrate-binding protein
MASKEVRHPADLKGLKLRVPGPTGKAVIEALGATPVAMPIPDLPQRLATHEVDGAMIPWEPIPAFKLQDFIKYFIEGPNSGRFGSTTFQVSMNKAKWDALPDDLKDVINKASDETWLKEVGDIWRGSEVQGLEMALSKPGNVHVVLTDAEYKEFTDALEPVVGLWIDQHSKDFDAKQLVEDARAAIAKYSQ